MAWKIFVETVTRVSTQPLAEHAGLLREAMTSLYGLFQVVREILKDTLPSPAQGKAPTVEQLAITMLNLELRPFLSRWHPQLRQWEQANPGADESAWPAGATCREELAVVQARIRDYAVGYARLAGVDDAAALITGVRETGDRSMATDMIYTASDLDRRRREVTDAARRGLARIRDTDGTGLVLLPARHYDVLEAVSRWYERLDLVGRARAKPVAERMPADFGDLTWLRHLDDEDLATFLAEVRAAVSIAYHDDDLSELEQLVRDWRTTADELADSARRETLLGGFDPADYVEAPRPQPRS